MQEFPSSVVMMGATGAVGQHVAKTLSGIPSIKRLTLLGRRADPSITGASLDQKIIDVLQPDSYRSFLKGHAAAVCTLGVGQPSKFSREEFLRVDQKAVFDFAKACKEAGIEHFELLGSVGANPRSKSFYLRTKGELEASLETLGFARLSLFRPSMLITPQNRYGIGQGIMLQLSPLIDHVLPRFLQNFHSIDVALLGRAMALNLAAQGPVVERLHWSDFQRLLAADKLSST